MTTKMHLGVFVNAAGNHIAGWRFPDALTSAEDFPGILNIAKIAEDAKLDFVFFADAPACIVDGPPGFVLQFEPTTLLGALSVSTSKIGLVATVSSTFTEPYNLARLIASLDQLSGGRIGWNVVTTAAQDAAANFGRSIPDHDTRYQIAGEYLEVVQGLWDSWEPGGRIANKETGEYIDKDKVHTLNHEGEYFKVRGPLGISRSPQGQPVIVQAGSSESGQAFAAKYAEVMFTVQQDLGEAEAFYRGMKAQVAAAGRKPENCNILPGLFTIIGRDEGEVRRKHAELARHIRPGSALKTMSERYGHDMSVYPMDEPVPDLPLSQSGAQSFATVLYAKARREKLTLKELHDIFALSRGYLFISGTPESIADTMEEWFANAACDGFMLTPAYFPAELELFAELVIPILQRRGLFRTDYEGTTLRSHFRLPEPQNRFTGLRSSQAATADVE